MVAGIASLSFMAARNPAQPKRSSGRRTSDKSLKLKRAPHAFALFLSHMKARARAYQKRRLRSKTTVWRMDLMSRRYQLLPASEKKPFVDKSLEALHNKQTRRVQLLQARRVAAQPLAESSVVVDHLAESPVVVEQPGSHATADAPRTLTHSGVEYEISQMWLSLPMPATSPGWACWHEGSPGMEEPVPPGTQWPRTWQWSEQPSGVQHDLIAAMHPMGSGSYGCCLSLKDKLTGESFCLKVPRATSEDPAAVECDSLKHEYRILVQLNHPNVVRAIAWISSRDGDFHGFLMPLGKGNLWQQLDGDGDLTRGDGVSILVQIARGLSYVHNAGLVHLDMKPENIIAYESADGCSLVQVADFGQSMTGPKHNRRVGSKIASDMVNTGVYRPLHLFAAAGAQVTVQYSFDVWAFGCIVFDVLLKHPRWRSKDGRAMRLFSGLTMRHAFETMRLRNYRLTRFLDAQAVALVVRFQPDRTAQIGPMRAELVRAVMDLMAQNRTDRT